MLAFPSYNYEGYFKLEQVVELKSAYKTSTFLMAKREPAKPDSL